MDPVGPRVEIDLLINWMRKVEKRIQSWTLWQDLLQYDAICAFVFESKHSNEKIDPRKWCGQKSENPHKKNFDFGLGTPLPLETSAVLSQIGDGEKRDES